jgi:hypothetical protein
VLRLLAGTGKTGCLQVEGDRGEGNVWVEAGAVVAARAERSLDDAPVSEVVFELLRFGSGSFRFAADEKAPKSDESHEVEQALRQATELLNEWRELEAVVPSLEHRVSIAPELTVDQVTVDAERWKTLVALAKGTSVGELGTSLAQGELAVSRTVSDLVELGIVVVEEPAAASTPQEAPQSGAASPSPRATGASRRSRAQRTEADDGATNGRRSAKTNGQREPRERPDPRDRPDQRDRRAAPSPAAHSREDREDDPQPTNGKLPRRSRSTGQRSGQRQGRQGRQVGSNGAGPLTAGRPGPSGSPISMANPSSSPFADGSVLPSGQTPVSSPALAGGLAPQPTVHSPVPQPTSASAGLSGLPPFDNTDLPGGFAGSALDAGLLGPSPLPMDTGQVPMVAASSLPPDLSWAAEDDDAPLGGAPLGASLSPPMGTPPVVPPAPPSANQSVPSGSLGASDGPGSALRTTGRSPLATPNPLAPPPHPAPPVGPMGDGETAAHVAVMSPDARHAVESIVGPSGGGSGLVPAAGATAEESNQRGALLGFLASVRSR